jgi:transcriptional regulator with XRE-family HTH domain
MTAEVRMNGIGVKSVGKKRAVTTDKPKTLKERFAANLRLLAGERPASSIADSMGVTPDTVLKWLRGDRTPDLDTWPSLAKALNLKDWRDLLPPS